MGDEHVIDDKGGAERETDGCRPPVKGDEAITFEEEKKKRVTETTNGEEFRTINLSTY